MNKWIWIALGALVLLMLILLSVLLKRLVQKKDRAEDLVLKAQIFEEEVDMTPASRLKVDAFILQADQIGEEMRDAEEDLPAVALPLDADSALNQTLQQFSKSALQAVESIDLSLPPRKPHS